MHQARKRTVTFSILIAAGLAVGIALYLLPRGEEVLGTVTPPGPPEPAMPHVSPPPPTVAVPVPPVPVPPVPPQVPARRPQVDLVFALDTTGSMSGLLEGAKRKIWSIANQVLSGQPKPDVRIGLVGYRDLGDAYVTRPFPLSEDIDEVYSNLRQFRAEGGGDTPEHVNKALADALRKMQWREGQNVLRLVFLVGDAPPHEGREGLYSSALAREAVRKGIIINTVRCGAQEDTEQAWKQLSLAAGGIYTSVRQDGGMVAIATPLDDKLAALNARLSATMLAAGGAGERAAAARRLAVNASMDGWAQAESAKFRARSGKLDSSDLLGKMAKGAKLEAMKDEELPAAVAAVAPPKRTAYVAKVAQQRAELQQEIDKLARDRDAYIKAKRPATAGVDDAVAGALKKQGAKAGIAY